MASVMRAVVLDAPGPPSALKIKDLPIPKPLAGQVLIKVKAFGLNRSEYHTRKGLAQGVTFPRVLGLEATGIVEEAPSGRYQKGQQIAAVVGGMGRTFDGGYAEYTCVPENCCRPFRSTLDWGTLGAIPESFETAAGSLEVLDLKEGDSLLIRGGTSSLGLFTSSIAKSMGVSVYSTTRSSSRTDMLKTYGVDHVLIDDGNVNAQLRKIKPEGVTRALELVGAGSLKDTISCLADKGVVCFAGMLSDSWVVPNFYPIDWLPRGTRLAAYGGPDHAVDFQPYIDAIEAGKTKVPVGKIYKNLEDIVEAHTLMEEGKASGKIVILTGM